MRYGSTVLIPLVPYSCSDVDECNTGNGDCEQMCTNTIGSFYCSCGTGYQLDLNGLNCSGKQYSAFTNSRMCTFDASKLPHSNADINECVIDEDNCHGNASCTNTEGSFTCSCNPGYTGDGVNCTSKLLTHQDM